MAYHLAVSRAPVANPVYIEASTRSPIGMSRGALSGWHPADLAGAVIEQLLSSAGLVVDEIDRVLVSNATPVGALGAVGRSIAVANAWPSTVEVVEVGSGHASGHSAIALARELVSCAAAERVVVASIDMASLVPPGAPLLRRDYGKPWGPTAMARFGTDGHLPEGQFAETLGIGRDDQDRYVLNRHTRAEGWGVSVAQIQSRRNDPDRGVSVPGATLTQDEALGGGLSLTDLSELAPMFDEKGSVTAANLSQPGDGAVAVLVSSHTSRWRIGETVVRSGLPTDPFTPLAEAWRVGDRGAPVVGLSETSAAHVLATAERLAIDIERINPHGGALARGRLDGGESLATIHDLTSGEQQHDRVALATLSGDGVALVTDLMS